MSPLKFALAALCAVAAAPAQAQTQSYRADYSVTFLGLPVASARFDSRFSPAEYAVEGTFRSSGLARLFDRTSGSTTVSGRISDGAPQPGSFDLNYVSGGKPSRTSIRFDGGNVASATNVPKPKRDPKTWVSVPARELIAAFDPLSWTLIGTADPAEVCNRTIRVFDGEMRADLRFSHREIGTLRGFEGEAVTCDARFVPVAGYRKGRKQVEYLRDRSRIAVTFVRLGQTGFFTPVDATIGTQIGPVRVSARSIEAR